MWSSVWHTTNFFSFKLEWLQTNFIYHQSFLHATHDYLMTFTVTRCDNGHQFIFLKELDQWFPNFPSSWDLCSFFFPTQLSTVTLDYAKVCMIQDSRVQIIWDFAWSKTTTHRSHKILHTVRFCHSTSQHHNVHPGNHRQIYESLLMVSVIIPLLPRHRTSTFWYNSLIWVDADEKQCDIAISILLCISRHIC